MVDGREEAESSRNEVRDRSGAGDGVFEDEGVVLGWWEWAELGAGEAIAPPTNSWPTGIKL